MGFLEELGADLIGGNMGGQGQYRGTGAIRVVEALDQMGIAGPATTRADGQTAGQLRLGGGREGSGLLVAHVHPFDLGMAAHRIDDRIQAVPHDAVNTLHPGLYENLHELIGHIRLRHALSSTAVIDGAGRRPEPRLLVG